MNKLISIFKAILTFAVTIVILLISQVVIGLIYQYSYIIKWSSQGITDMDLMKDNLITKTAASPYLLLVTGVSAGVLLVVYGLKYYFSLKKAEKSAKLVKIGGSHILSIILTFLGFLLVWKAIEFIGYGNNSGNMSKLLRIANLSLKDFIFIRLFIYVISASTEEFIFHGIIFQRLRMDQNFWVSNLFAASLVAVFQFNVEKGIFAFTLALFIGYVFEMSNSILLCVGVRIYIMILLILGSWLAITNMTIAVVTGIIGLAVIAAGTFSMRKLKQKN